jgi:predicted DCC family thiol-disulfide oxidoreductase YuxK
MRGLRILEIEMSQTAQLEVYTDGQCPLCRWMRSKVEPRDRFNRIEWMDYRDPEVQSRTPYTFEQLDKEMHARRIGDGGWSAGYGAWLDVMRVLPRWRIVAPLISIWPFTFLGRLFYRQLASRRYQLFGVPPPCDTDGVCSLHKESGQ